MRVERRGECPPATALFLFIGIANDAPLLFGPYDNRSTAVAAVELCHDLGWAGRDPSLSHYLLDAATFERHRLTREPEGTFTINGERMVITDSDRRWLPHDSSTLPCGAYPCPVCKRAHYVTPTQAALGRRS